MSQIIFESTDKGATQIFDDDGLILKFNRLNINIIRNSTGLLTRSNEGDSWIAVVEDSEIIQRAKKHKAFEANPPDDDTFYSGIKFRIIDRIPTKKNRETIIKLGPSANLSEIKTKSKRLGELETQLLKQDGNYVKGAIPEEITEYEQLKKELE